MRLFQPLKAWPALRLGSLALFLGAVALYGLLAYKNQLQKQFSQSKLRSLQLYHAPFRDLFQTSFYFHFEDQFLPEIKSQLNGVQDLKRVIYFDRSGKVLFDSETPYSDEKSDFPVKEAILTNLKSGEVLVQQRNTAIEILMPAGSFSILYQFRSSTILSSLFLWASLSVLMIGLAIFSLRHRNALRFTRRRIRRFKRWFGLRSKFILTIILVNLITGVIVYFTLVELQSEEQKDRIKKESLLFGQFSTQQIISTFSKHFYFYFQDKFIPSMNAIIATNENLMKIRIISFKDRKVLFDSTDRHQSPVPEVSDEKLNYSLSSQEEAILRSRGVVSRDLTQEGDSRLLVINRYANENQETLYLVEYTFGYQSLSRLIVLIQNQILIDLIPAMILGLIIALAFAQFLISPIRKLSEALKRVSEGDYDVSLPLDRSDEIGALLESFNAMTLELRKKTELKKYLSDTTYRHIMESPEVLKGEKLKGSRVNAAILFSDIRNFVQHCEHLEAEEITSMLNDYFSEMVQVVYENGGEVDKFIGDAILAVFYPDPGVKEKDSDASLRAIYCGLQMQERLKQFNVKRVESGKKIIEIGVGISFGEILSGPIGSQDRRDFTVIGDVVNLANRIEKLTKHGKHTKIVFSHHVEETIRGLLDYELMETGKIRGKTEEVLVYELIQIKDLSTLIKNLKSDSLDLKLKSIELLGHSLNPQATQALIHELFDKDSSVRIKAIESLRMLARPNDSEILDALFKALESEKLSKVQSKFISSIGEICSTSRLMDLEPYLHSDDERIVANTIEAIGRMDSEKVNDLILPFLGSVHNRIKANAAMVLFSSGKSSVLDTLKPMLLHSDHLMRSSAAFAIGELTLLAKKESFFEALQKEDSDAQAFMAELQECVPMLVFLLKDREISVRKQAIMALGKIRDRSAVLPLINAVQYDEHSKALVEDIANAVSQIGAHKLVRDLLERK